MQRRRLVPIAVLSVLLGACASSDDAGTARPLPSRTASTSTPGTPAPAAGTTSPPPAPTASVGPSPLPVEIGTLNGLSRAPGDHPGTVTVAGVDRSFTLRVPPQATAGTPLPLLIALHPLLGTSRSMANLTGLSTVTDREGIVVVYPQGLDRAWNGGLTCCNPSLAQDTPDVAFISGLIDALMSGTDGGPTIDPTRVWVTGFSNGGFLAHRLACESADRVTAIVSVAGILDLPCTPSAPVSVLQVHGDRDGVIAFDPGPGAGPVSPQASGRGAAAVAAAWAGIEGCDQPPAAPVVDGILTTTTWSGCEAGATVMLDVLVGVGHQWFRDAGVDTSELVVGFLNAHGTRP